MERIRNVWLTKERIFIVSKIISLSRNSPKLFSLGTGDCSNHCEHNIVPNDDLKSYSCGRNKETEIPIFRGVYTFPVDPIPRKNCFGEEAMQFLQDGVSKIKPNPSPDSQPSLCIRRRINLGPVLEEGSENRCHNAQH